MTNVNMANSDEPYGSHHNRGNTNPAKKDKHQKGNKRRIRDAGNEKGDSRREDRSNKRRKSEAYTGEVIEGVITVGLATAFLTVIIADDISVIGAIDDSLIPSILILFEQGAEKIH